MMRRMTEQLLAWGNFNQLAQVHDADPIRYVPDDIEPMTDKHQS